MSHPMTDEVQKILDEVRSEIRADVAKAGDDYERVEQIFEDFRDCRECALARRYADLPDEPGGWECDILHGQTAPDQCPELQRQKDADNER